jgi:hypothetical protein
MSLSFQASAFPIMRAKIYDDLDNVFCKETGWLVNGVNPVLTHGQLAVPIWLVGNRLAWREAGDQIRLPTAPAPITAILGLGAKIIIPASLQKRGRQSQQNEIATPFGLAMTCQNTVCICICLSHRFNFCGDRTRIEWDGV